MYRTTRSAHNQLNGSTTVAHIRIRTPPALLSHGKEPILLCWYVKHIQSLLVRYLWQNRRRPAVESADELVLLLLWRNQTKPSTFVEKFSSVGSFMRKEKKKKRLDVCPGKETQHSRSSDTPSQFYPFTFNSAFFNEQLSKSIHVSIHLWYLAIRRGFVTWYSQSWSVKMITHFIMS